MSLESSIIKLEQDIREFKTSQAIGSSSSRVVPVGTVDINLNAVGYIGVSLVGKFTASNVINPIIMPRLTVEIDGQPVTSESSSAYMTLTYDDYEAALIIDYHTSEGYILPDEKTATFYLYVLSNISPDATHNFKIKGTVYGTCEGDLKLYAFNS